MKTLIKLVLVNLLFFNSILNAQNADAIINSNYFNEYSVENYYLDTDKSEYFSGENIYFKLYVTEEKSNTLNLLAKNVHITLFSEKEGKIDNQTLLVDNGIVFGYFKTEKDYTSGDYYFQVNSNYNSNFKGGKNFPLKIISFEDLQKENSSNETIDQDVTKPKTVKPFVSFHPESNSLINNIFNKIIIKTNLPNNTEIKIIDQTTNTVVNTPKVNQQGQAIAFFKNNANYQAKITINNKEFTYSLPVAKPEGFTIFKNRTAKNATKKTFILKTNHQTISSLQGQKLFVILHNKGVIKSFAEITLNSAKTDYLLSFQNKDLFEGINTVSIFNEKNQPIVNRYFYNESKKQTINIGKLNTTQDSLQLNLNSDFINKFANLSLSVHAEDFLEEKTNIKSALYFNNNPETISSSFLNNESLIDNYLQIKSTETNPYPYQKIAKNEVTFKREFGFKLKGRLNTAIVNPSEYKVMLTSKENSILLVNELNKDKTFVFDNIILKKNSNYELALLNKKGKIVKGSFFVYKQYTKFQNKSSITLNEVEKLDQFIVDQPKEKLDNVEFMSFKDAQKLDEVSISATKIDKNKSQEKDLKSRGIVGVGFSRIFKPSDSPYSKVNILQYFQTLPGVTLKYNSDNTAFLNNERVLKTFNNTGDIPFNLILDGTPIGTGLALVDFRLASDFEYILVNRKGAGYGSSFPGGVIVLVTKKGVDGKPLARKNANLKDFIAEFGFSENYERFQISPINFATNTLKKKFKTLDWHPNINIFKDKFTTIKINTDGYKNVKLTINGITDEGKLIYQIINL